VKKAETTAVGCVLLENTATGAQLRAQTAGSASIHFKRQANAHAVLELRGGRSVYPVIHANNQMPIIPLANL
jgi:hypothetical protein